MSCIGAPFGDASAGSLREIWRPVYPERRTVLLAWGSVRRTTVIWAVDRLQHSQRPRSVRDPSPADQIADVGIDLAELFVLAWQVLRHGLGATWARARRRLHTRLRWRAPRFRPPIRRLP